MSSDSKQRKHSAIVSAWLDDGRIVETIYNQNEGKTGLATFDGKTTVCSDSVSDAHKSVLSPVSGHNNLIKHGAVLFAEKPTPFDSIASLVSEIQEYIYRYVDLSDHFRKIAAYYVLLTWVYDAFNELPYLRLRGDYGSGKTRALYVIGSICNKPFFASGASTVSPIFHVLDTFRGTLIFDEADFRFSDEKNELVKIFNNGNVRGFPVLRTAFTAKKEFDPRAFNVFGPKIVAMRKSFDDPALESRFLTEEMGQRSLRSDIPINLPDIQKDEALQLRNKLLMYRFTTLPHIRVNTGLVDVSLSPRMNQILVPLLSIIDDEALKADVRRAVRVFDEKLYAERSTSIEACVLSVLVELFQDEPSNISLSAITEAFNAQYSKEFERQIPVREVGRVLRRKLRLYTYKSHGIYVLPASEAPKVIELCRRYGVLDRIEPAQTLDG